MIGIENVNEFYTNHYLAAIVSKEIKPHLERWRAQTRQDEGSSTPWQRLAQLQQEFFRFKDQLPRRRGATARVEAHKAIASALLGALGYELTPLHRELSMGPLPLLGAWTRASGEPLLWILAAPSAHKGEDKEPTDSLPDDGLGHSPHARPDEPATARSSDADLLARSLLREQHGQVPRADGAPEPERTKLRAVHKRSVEELVSDAFGLEDAPRFVLVVGDTQWILADRGKWAEQRLLRFDWVELLSRRETQTLELVTALLHRELLAPESGTTLVDTLNDSSHKHAYEVSEDLKIALRESIERIGNEAIRYRRYVSNKKVFGEEIDGQELAIQCIRYMYRILFLLYIEARPELGYAPMGSDAYRLGYSFERLRDLEMLELDTPEAREGHYIHECLDRLFRMVYEGTDSQRQQALLTGADAPWAEEDSKHHTFNIVPLRSHLFDPGRTEFLRFGFVRLSNEVLLEVIKAMSLSAPKGTGKNKRRGRISYATLGINQLGAVYEALLSFRGFFAEHTLYEVKPAKVKKPDPVKDPAYFVPEGDLHQYKKDERVFDDQGEPVSYPAGSFIYRMAGRDRQKSASYYTPEVLTKCLVKYSLKELLENQDGSPKFAKAEDLLELTICEPAMGSAAFLNEAINQLSERYLQRRQQELGERIPHERYRQELQRVRMYIADNNVYGVDLNPIAIELAELSLWLNAIFTEDTKQGAKVFVPWFGGQLACGNSLVGAWRKVFTKEQLRGGKKTKNTGWLDAVPERIMLGTPRPEGSVYHFLLPDRGMAVYGQGNEGKPIREMCKAELATIEVWRGKMCAPLSEEDLAALVRLSDAIDKLWTKHIELSRKIRERTTDPLSVYGHEHPLAGQREATTTEAKDRIWSKEMASEQVRASSPYQRLKLAMDYWCALWFWPIQEAELLPDRGEWLMDMALLLDSDVLPDLKGGAEQRDLFAPTMPVEEARQLVDEVGFADVERMIVNWTRFQAVSQLYAQNRFFHWELEFCETFESKGGFSLVIGNPPWVRVEWREVSVLADIDPRFAIKGVSALGGAGIRKVTLEASPLNTGHYLNAHEEASATQGFLAARSIYNDLRGLKANLYKAFIVLAWGISGPRGVSGLVHPEKPYDEPTGQALRAALYPRLRFHFHFFNELKLFPISHARQYSLNVYSAPRRAQFRSISNLFSPTTIDESLSCPQVSSPDPSPGLKNKDGEWDLRGHHSRIITIGQGELEVFSTLLDGPDSEAASARLLGVHSTGMLRGLDSFVNASVTLKTLVDNGDAAGSFHLNETYAQNDSIITKEPGFVRPDRFIFSGPHFHVGNSFRKSPAASFDKDKKYNLVDLMDLSEHYLPRTVFRPLLKAVDYRETSRSLPWTEEVRFLECYRLITPAKVDPRAERVLKAAVAFPGAGQIDSVYGWAFRDTADLVDALGTWMSLPCDAFIKSINADNLRPNIAVRLPVLRNEWIGRRALLLVCTTQHFSHLWNTHASNSVEDRWAYDDPLLGDHSFERLGSAWDPASPVRSHYARRQLRVEIDVLAAMSLNWTLAQLTEAYRGLFYVLDSNEKGTWYDQNGRVVYSSGRAMKSAGLPTTCTSSITPCWNDVKHMSEEAGYTGTETVTQIVIDDTLPGGPREKTITYHAPWVRCNRERDYEIAWEHFARRFGLEGHS